MSICFPYLNADDIEVRVGQASDKGVSLLLYKDARCDMRILDNVVGAENWQCDYESIDGKLFCTVSIWSEERHQWISKQDVGTPSNMEADKGECSDAFKRSCFKWGIGRELYSAPFIWVPSSNCTISRNKQGKPTCYDKFRVASMEVADGRIVGLTIVNAKTGSAVFSTGNVSMKAPKPQMKANTPSEPVSLAPAADDAMVAERKRAWFNIKSWAANHNGDPNNLLQGVKMRPEYEDSADFWGMIADEFAE